MYRSVLQLSNTTRTNLPRRKAVSLAVASLLSLACAQATAQSGPATDAQQAPAADTDSKTEIVTVTATRRREPIRDVPLRVETISTESLERSGAASLTDYVGSLPGVHVESDGGPGRGQVNIRGVVRLQRPDGPGRPVRRARGRRRGSRRAVGGRRRRPGRGGLRHAAPDHRRPAQP